MENDAGEVQICGPSVSSQVFPLINVILFLVAILYEIYLRDFTQLALILAQIETKLVAQL